MRNCSHTVSKFIALAALTTVVSPVWAGKIRTQVETRRVSLPVEVQYQFSRLVRPGALVKAQEGQPGTITRTYQVTFDEQDKPVKRVLIDTERTAGTPTVFNMNRSGFTTSRGNFRRGKVLEMSASAYDASPRTLGRRASGRTKMGYRAEFGHVAVDPRVVPLGSLVYVEGYGFAMASDIGGAIRGRRIDLCFNSRSQAMRFGRRKVKVHVLHPSR